MRLSEIPASDYSVLLELPALERVTVSASAENVVEPLAAQAGFTVEYE